jgi:predicted SAM-dependent methyltransferase
MKRGSLLHVGCGGDPLPKYLNLYEETRLDIDETHSPDIISSMTDLGDIGEFDVVLCSHALEHLHPEEAVKAMIEFHRVTKKGGAVIVFVPDLEGIKATNEVVYESTAGPITGLDMIYGFTKMTKDNHYMRHLTGFVSFTLSGLLTKTGFTKVTIKKLNNFSLMGVGVK